MTIPSYQRLMLPVLRLAAAGEQRVADITGDIAGEFDLTQAEREELLPSGRQSLLYNRIHWAKTYLAKAGLIATPQRGRFIITEAGRKLLAGKPEQISLEELKHYPEFCAFYNSPKAPDDAAPVVRPPSEDTGTPEEQIEAACQAVDSALRVELLERISQNSPFFFEQLIIDLLLAMGYGGSHRNAGIQLGRSGDGGVDGVINEDRLGLERVYVQAKRYAAGNTVGASDVRDFVGSLVGHGASKGVFVTTSGFSSQGRDYVEHLPQRVILIDGEQLADLMVEYGVGIRVSRRVELKRLDEDFFTEE